MDFEAIVWIYLPLAIAIVGIVWSIKLTVQKKTLFELIVSIVVYILNGFSIYMLVWMFLGAWPTFIPHIAILISTLLLIIQKFRHKRN